MFSAEEKLLMRLLRESLRGKKKGVISNREFNTQELFRLAKSHAVLPLLYDRLHGRLGEETYENGLQAAANRTVTQAYHLLFLGKYTIDVLEAAGIRSVLLKGTSTASLYPVPELRKSGDIDLFLVDREKEREAKEALIKAGFQRSGSQHANHHIVYHAPGQIEMELHLMFAEPFDDDGINRYMERVGRTVGKHIIRKEIMGVELPILSDSYHAYQLLLHMLQHFLREGFGLKLLCDWVVFWNREIEVREIRRFLKLVGESGLTGFLSLITTICADHLGLAGNEKGIYRKDRTFFYEGGIFCRMTEISKSNHFLEDILKGEEFGKGSKDRMVVLRGTGIMDYVREFHHQMHLNYPKAGKNPVLWPGLWAATLAKFLYNNRRLHRASVGKIMRRAGERSRRIAELQLFRPQTGKERKS